MSILKKAMDWVDNKKRILDLICASLLALVPILQHYEGLVDNAASTLLALLVPYLALRMIPRLKGLRVAHISLFAIMILFWIYRVIDHGTTFFELAQAGLVIGYLVAVSIGCIDVKALTKTASVIAAAAGTIMLVQYFCFYILGFHLQVVPVSLLLDSSEQWILGATTGLGGITGKIGTLYRPSAFFLEPSHMFMYSFPLLCINMFTLDRTKFNKYVSALIALGMVLSTSGMGIVVVAGVFVLFFALWNEKNNTFELKNVVRKRNLILLGVALGAMVLAIIFVPFVRNSVMRIFFSQGGSTAISGRTQRAMKLLGKMNFGQIIMGVADTTSGIKYNVPGFMATIYKYGIVGVVLSYEYFVKGLFKFDLGYFCFAGLWVLVSFFSAHTHGTFFMLYYMLLMVVGYKTTTGTWIEEIKNMFSKVKSLLKK